MLVIEAIHQLFPWLRHLFADSVYNGANLRDALAKLGNWTVEIVKRAADAAGFQLLPRRWVVERTLAWLNRNRRLAKDFEGSIASAKAWVYIASVQPHQEIDLPVMQCIYDIIQPFRLRFRHLVKGVFRFVGGKMSKENFEITTPAAKIGLRGTAFTVYILQNGSEYISVESGVISVTCRQGVTRILGAGQMTFIQSPHASATTPQPAVPIPAVLQMDALLH